MVMFFLPVYSVSRFTCPGTGTLGPHLSVIRRATSWQELMGWGQRRGWREGGLSDFLSLSIMVD